MKYVEQLKSFVLLFLVPLSLVLTFTIWTYKPPYKVIEETPVDEVMINEKKQLKDVLKPYRLLFRQSNQFHGTVSTAAIDDLYSQLTTWQAREVSLINSNLSNEKLNEILRLNNRIALFFSEEVPLQVFSSVVSFNESELPDISFDQLILDWGSVSTNNQLQLLFVNTETRTLHRSYVTLPNAHTVLYKDCRSRC